MADPRDKDDDTGSAADSHADEAGRPFKEGELDPELLKLPRSKPRVGPILAGAIIVLSVFLIGKLWGDLWFSLGGDEPTTYDSIPGLLDKGEPGEYVAIRAVPDRTVGGLVRKSKADEGQFLRPVFGSDQRLWLLTAADHWNAHVEHSEVHTGRLRRLGEFRFFEQFVAFMNGDAGLVPRAVEPTALGKALESRAGGAKLSAVGGGLLELSPETRVEIREIVPGKIDVVGYYTDTLVDGEVWASALKGAGFVIDDERAYRVSEQSAAFRISTTGSLRDIRTKLTKNKLYSAEAEVVRRKHVAPWKETTTFTGGLELAGAQVGWDAIESAVVYFRHPVRADSLVVVVADRPDGYWYVVPVSILLAAIAGLFLFVLVRPFVGRSARSRPAS